MPKNYKYKPFLQFYQFFHDLTVRKSSKSRNLTRKAGVIKTLGVFHQHFTSGPLSDFRQKSLGRPKSLPFRVQLCQRGWRAERGSERQAAERRDLAQPQRRRARPGALRAGPAGPPSPARAAMPVGDGRVGGSAGRAFAAGDWRGFSCRASSSGCWGSWRSPWLSWPSPCPWCCSPAVSARGGWRGLAAESCAESLCLGERGSQGCSCWVLGIGRYGRLTREGGGTVKKSLNFLVCVDNN